MSNILQTFLSAIIFVLIIHFLIKHYLLNIVSNKNSNYLKKKVRFQEKTNRIHYIPRYQDTYNREQNDTQGQISQIPSDIVSSNTDKNGDTSNNSTSSKTLNIKNEILKFINVKHQSIKENKSEEDQELNKFFQMNNEEEYELSDLALNNNYEKCNKNCTSLSEKPETTEININPYENSNYGKSYSSLY